MELFQDTLPSQKLMLHLSLGPILGAANTDLKQTGHSIIELSL